MSQEPAPRNEEVPFSRERPETLPTFQGVGGMEELKAELRETVGLALAFPGEADAYRLTWNGILLHGRPGVGKRFVARAAAGEFGVNFIAVSAGDLVSAYRSESGRNVAEAFAYAARNIPSLLVFDEFDSIAENREDWPDQEARRTVNQLLQALVEYRVVRKQIVMAATNDIEGIDPAVIRPGRFDRLIRADLPDETGRVAILSLSVDVSEACEKNPANDWRCREKGLGEPSSLAACPCGSTWPRDSVVEDPEAEHTDETVRPDFDVPRCRDETDPPPGPARLSNPASVTARRLPS